MRIAGIIVLFNPDNEVWTNINSYLSEIEVLYAVDNSVKYNLQLIDKIRKNKKIEYINNLGNKGIASALNIGAELAINAGYDWLLTMDQDSSATEKMVVRMLSFIEIYKESHLLAILSPNHFYSETQTNKLDCSFYENFRINYELMVMTSGNLLNLNLFPSIGQFEEKLFIDYVDHEIGLRINSLGFRIIKLLDVRLNHKLGDIRLINRFINFHCTNHNYIRRYYIARNQLFVYNKYKNIFPEFCKNDLFYHLKEWVKIFLGEEDKFRKIKSIIRGIRDHRRNRYGRYNYPN